eukprot:633247-Amorphochlora_amoeboformis.AAC.2
MTRIRMLRLGSTIEGLQLVRRTAQKCALVELQVALSLGGNALDGRQHSVVLFVSVETAQQHASANGETPMVHVTPSCVTLSLISRDQYRPGSDEGSSVIECTCSSDGERERELRRIGWIGCPGGNSNEEGRLAQG